jgi:GntR family transcriptional regulator
MATTDRREPKYRAIVADLGARIRSGQYPPGSALPPQRALSVSYGVTLATLRQALRRLQDDGLLSQQPGRGTFVAQDRATDQLDPLRGWAEDLRTQGQPVSTEIVGRARRRPPGWVAGVLGTGADEWALRLERTRLVAGRPAVHQVSWVRQPAAGLLAEDGPGTGSLYAALAGAGVLVHQTTETLRPGLLDEPAAGLLREAAGTPVFVCDRTTYDPDGRPVVFDRATILGTVVEIRTERAAGGLSMRWSRQPPDS